MIILLEVFVCIMSRHCPQMRMIQATSFYKSSRWKALKSASLLEKQMWCRVSLSFVLVDATIHNEITS